MQGMMLYEELSDSGILEACASPNSINAFGWLQIAIIPNTLGTMATWLQYTSLQLVVLVFVFVLVIAKHGACHSSYVYS